MMAPFIDYQTIVCPDADDYSRRVASAGGAGYDLITAFMDSRGYIVATFRKLRPFTTPSVTTS